VIEREYPSARLGDVARIVRGITFKPADVVPPGTPGTVDCMRTKNVQVELDTADVWAVEASLVKREDQFLVPGDTLVSSANSWNLVGKCCWVPGLARRTTFGGFISALRADGQQIDDRYLYRWFSSGRTQKIVRGFARQTTNIANLDIKRCLELAIPLPPLVEQRRVVDVLDRVDVLRAKRRESLAHLDELAQSVFSDIFGDVATNERSWDESRLLSDVADIVSGVTKGRAVRQVATRSVPYLAVVNVQDMRLDLRVVKTIEATDAEIDRYRLQINDLLLTEGGDPDKLGRGVLWRGEIPECIHQNHIFRVRLKKDSKILPVFLNWLVSSARGRSYFLRCAKQTTGIASINATQLRNFPLLAPPVDMQERFTEVLSKIERQRRSQRAHLVELDSLFEGLQYRAFRGEL
jgi:type I restriction enzyme S subunit